MLVVDSSFRTLAMEPEQPIGIDSWDQIIYKEPIAMPTQSK